MNPLPSEKIAVLGTIDPDAYAGSPDTTEVSDYVDIGLAESIQFILLVGDIGSGATIDAVVQQATDSAGTGAKALSPSKTITQLTQAGGDSNKQVVINVRGEELDLDNNFDHVAVSVTITGSAGSDFGALVLGHNVRYNPASDNDISSVDEIVS